MKNERENPSPLQEKIDFSLASWKRGHVEGLAWIKSIIEGHIEEYDLVVKKESLVHNPGVLIFGRSNGKSVTFEIRPHNKISLGFVTVHEPGLIALKHNREGGVKFFGAEDVRGIEIAVKPE